MKNLIFGLALLMACSSTPGVDEKPVETPVAESKFYGQLKVESGKLVDSEGKSAMLRGVSFGWHNWWPRFYNPSAVKHLKDDWKVNLVRASMGVGPDGAYLDEPEFAKEKVKAVVDAAIEAGIYVIIDWHSHDIYEEEAKLFFAEMAQTYGDYPNVIYEIFNEPDDETWPEVKAYSESLITEIRKHDPDNIILVGTTTWSQDLHLAMENPIENQQNIMYVLHFYAATHKTELLDRAERAYQSGLPIFVSECAGMEATGDGPIDQESWRAWLYWMESRRISWAAWSIADKDETCSMLLPQAPSEGGWADDHLKPWGKTVKHTLVELHSKE